MAAPQNPQQAIDVMGPVTVVHVALMLALAAAAIVVIWWGAVLRARRKRAEKQVSAQFDAAEQHGATASPPVATATLDGAAPAADDVPPAPGVAGEAAVAANLTQIKGLGPKLVTLLGERGISCVAQLAALDPAAAAALDADLGPFSGRMARDRWVEQARLLKAGDRAGYEAAFGKLGS